MIGPDAKGLASDTVATLTPFVLGQDLRALGQPPWVQWAAQSLYAYEEDRMYYWNQSLPHGFFSRSPLGEVKGSLSTDALPPAWLKCHALYTQVTAGIMRPTAAKSARHLLHYLTVQCSAVQCKAPNFLTPLNTGGINSGVVLLELTITTCLHLTMCQYISLVEHACYGITSEKQNRQHNATTR